MLDLTNTDSVAASDNSLSDVDHNVEIPPSVPKIVKLDSVGGFAQVRRHLTSHCQTLVMTTKYHLQC